MAASQLSTLRDLLADELDGVALGPVGLTAPLTTRWGEVTVSIEPDDSAPDDGAVALRVQVALPLPAGSGQEFLVWCLTTNVQYWGVKLGIQSDGMLLVHADLEAESSLSLPALAGEIVDRVDSLQQLLDEDLSDWCLQRKLGTPAQRVRWETIRPAPPDEG